MEIDFRDGIIHLRGQTAKEEKFLKKAFDEGLRVFGGGSSTTLCLPSAAKLKQLHLEDDQLIMISYALGRCDKDLRKSYGNEKVQVLVSIILHPQ